MSPRLLRRARTHQRATWTAVAVALSAVSLAVVTGACRSGDGAGTGTATEADAPRSDAAAGPGAAAVAGDARTAAGGDRSAPGGATGLPDAPPIDAAPGAPPRSLPTTVARIEAPPEPGPPAADPAQAVSAFVAAEAAADAPRAWSLLSAADRRRYPTAELWRTEHRQLPRLRAVRLDGAARPVGADAVELPAEVRFDADLDATRGMVPAAATATWRAVREDGGWRVDYAGSRFDATLPAEDRVGADALAWAQHRQQCRTRADDGRALEVVGGVVGIAGLAERLCRADGTIRAGTAAPVVATDATAVVAAFGPGALGWARVVDVDGPVPQRVVMGPLGDRWIAIGVLAPPAR